MKTLLLLAAAIAIAMVLLIALSKKGQKSSDESKQLETPKKKTLMSQREQAMYNRLVGALPQARVLAQVSFGALLSARTRAIRSTFDRKIADFVICDPAMQVLAIIELDDKSHRDKEGQDGYRDAMLVNAGYRILRYSNVPDIDQVQRDFPSLITPKGAPYENNDESTRASPINSSSTVLARETQSQPKRAAQRTPARPH
ncbi:DUF2726 domain-containing protein [Pulveribacter sp.]|uniref:DUF2726 domain-containing protein n=1 Tax=Pulveribacter sp. TaxID=2678893 RepID=UPI0028AD8693|nr:DUF2726 domain-containing protein [Pulveribacter sp.]